MFTMKIGLPWTGAARRKDHNGVVGSIARRDLHTAAQMATILERERARADRTRTGFSLLVLRSRTGGRKHATLHRAANYLRHRLRATDELGWLDDEQLCVVLSATMPTGAWKIVEAIRSDWRAEEMPEFTVYYYPSDNQTPPDPQGETRVTLPEQVVGCEPVRAESMDALFAKPVHGWKRCLDILGACVALVLLSPVLGAAALAIRLTSPGPILFGQMRSGRGGVPFRMLKFRSMVVDAEAKKKELLALNEQDGPAFKLRSDPRVTRVGKFLRRTSIDELPQLWNVLKGEMSLVGPRPLPCDETANCRSWHRRRIDVTPGLTCIWQLKGRSTVSFDEWVRMDINYIRQHSLKQDLQLLIGTVPVLLWRTSGC